MSREAEDSCCTKGMFISQGDKHLQWLFLCYCRPVAYPGILFWGGGSSTNSVEDRGQRERGSGGGSTLIRGSGGSCNLVQEISFNIVKFS